MLQVSTQRIERGLVRFRCHNDWDRLIKLTEEKPLSSIVEDQNWDISQGKYRQMIDNGTIQSIQRLEIASLKVRWGNLVNIIREIKGITFPCLKELHLNGNSIENLQALYLLDMKHLAILNLKQNNITNLRILPKCRLPSLVEITLFKNKILDFTPLQKLKAPKLTKIWTTPQIQIFDTNQASSWIFRTESKKLSKLYIKHERGQSFDFQQLEAMGHQCYGKSLKLIYKIEDDMHVRRRE